MKSIFYLVLTIMIFAAVAFNSNKEEQANETDTPTSVQTTKQLTSELTTGLDEVLNSLAELKTITEDSTWETEKIQTTGESLGETWDQIEKQVEEKYPEDYERIEQSLYPLLAEARKDNPDLALVMQFLNATTEKIEVFKKMVGATSS